MSKFPDDAPGPRTHGDRTLVLLTLAAAAVRVGFLLLEPSCGLQGDEPSWVALGTRELGRPNRGLNPLRVHFVFYPPVYPYFMAVLFRAFGSLKAVAWGQALLGALLVPAVGRAGALAFGRRAGLLAAAVTAFWPEFVWFSTHFWSETVFLVLLWWAIERTLCADARGSTRVAAVAGVLWGLTALTRELALYLVPVVALWMLRPSGEADRTAGARFRPRAGAILRVATLGLAAVLVIAPWTVRNALVFRAFIPVSTMGGLALWQGNTTLTHLQIYEVVDAIDGPVEQDRYCRRMGWAAIAARQPTWIFEKLVEQVPEFWKAGSEMLDHYGGREACGPMTAGQLVALELLLVPPYLAVLGLFVFGLARVRLSGGAWLLVLVLCAYNSAHVVTLAMVRYRLPVTPVVFLVAAAAVAGWREGSLAPLRGWRAVVLAALALVALACVGSRLVELLAWRLLVGLPA